MTELQITETAIPEVTREKAPNPFRAHFPTKDGKALAIVLDGDKDNSKDVLTEFNRLTGQARRAADELNPPMTAKVVGKVEGTGKNAKTHMSIWTVEKQRRPRTETAAE